MATTTVSPTGAKIRKGNARAQFGQYILWLTPSGGDDSVMMQNAIDELNGSGEILLGPGVFRWLTLVPAFAPNAAGITIRAAGRDSTTIQLSTGAPRCFDFGKTADYDLFCNIEISDFTLDCNNVGGKHHGIWGTYQNGQSQQRLSFDSLAARRIKVINQLTDVTETSQRLASRIQSQHQTQNEATQTWVINVIHEDIDVLGGNGGIFVNANTNDTTLYPNVFVDRIYIRRCTYDSLVVPTQTWTAGGFQIGEKAIGRRGVIQECHARNCGDCGIEVDNMQDALVETCTVTDAWNGGFASYNKSAQVWLSGDAGSAVGTSDPIHQANIFRDCWDYYTSSIPTTASHHGFSQGFIDLPTEVFGTAIYEHCGQYKTNARFNLMGYAFSNRNTQTYRTILRDFHVIDYGASVNTTGTASASAIQISPAGGCVVTVEDLRIKLNATIQGGITVSWYGLLLNNVTTTGGIAPNYPGDLQFTVDRVHADVAFTCSGGSTQNGNSALIAFGIGLGGNGPCSTTGELRRVIVDSWSGDSSSQPIWFDTASVIPDRVDIGGCDFTALSGQAGTDVYFAASSTAAGYVYSDDTNRWRGTTWPANLAATIRSARAQPTYGATVTPNAQVGTLQRITATNGTAFTIAAPILPPGANTHQSLIVEVVNSSGGALGVITWNATFVFAGQVWTSPANTKKRFARFEWNGANWICTGVAAADY